MEFRYSAFISYRHHPRDIRAAEQIQRGLEHYRVPRALRRQGRTIARLFRDYEDRLLCFDAAGGLLHLKDGIRFADDISFFVNSSGHEITLSLDHYTHSVFCREPLFRL